MLAWQEFAKKVDEAERVLLTTHVRPDGDALGSELGMADLLIQKGKEVEILNASPTPPRYWFMDPGDPPRVKFLQMGVSAPPWEPDLIVILDTGTWSQLAELGPYIKQSAAPKVVIDHHVSQDELGALRLVDTSAAACGMLVYEAFHQLHGELTPASAAALFVAIAMDTGWMRHSNCSTEVFAALGDLLHHGAQPSQLYRQLFECNRVERLKLLGIMLERIKLIADGKLAYSHVLWQDIIDVGAHPMETEDLINFPMSLEGAEGALIFIGQSEGGTKVSFRSQGKLDCSELASRFGGGGHRAAAGASLSLPVEQAMATVLPIAQSALRHQLLTVNTK